jgi:hypothetical protein
MGTTRNHPARLRSPKNAAVVTHLRSRGRVLLTPFALEQRLELPIAA